MAAMASSCCSSSSLAVQSIPSHGAISKSTTASLKALPALPALRRSGVTYGVPGAVKDRRVAGRPSALFGGGGADDKKPEKKFITKEQEPDQYWTTAAEREGKNPMQTLLPYIALLTILSPFAILAVAYANNWIKLPN
ncbi:uncharacterized protein [Physcomitrium patens]|uniref:Uncharacterized protein n=1 Tax=Physcomitrium patens TaxID=3218 RepID=A0A2K1IS24_PHYPA|nr:uncharacterized protein LOC112273914 [Physcomitrium patens]PNR32077.1 hypothetical protein PHYPA_026202 [Physcomitrium patens]|eukprot:XP_024358733.1 uncharacterized protein LOC112273914 [Physcomitrella patens]